MGERIVNDTIEKEWLIFAEALGLLRPHINPHQLADMKHSFFAGALTIISQLSKIGNWDEDDALIHLGCIEIELTTHFSEIEKITSNKSINN